MTATHSVTVTRVTTTTDSLGNSTEAPTTSTATVRFAPEGMVENANSTSPRVIGDATLYGATPHLDADDTIVHASGCCAGDDFDLGTWQVVGGSRGWGRGRKAVPIRRTGAT